MFIELTDAEKAERLAVNVNKICTIRPYREVHIKNVRDIDGMATGEYEEVVDFEGTRLFFETEQVLIVSEKYNEIKEKLWRLDLADFSHK